MAESKFVKFIGNCWLKGRDVAVYEAPGGVRLTPETVGGKVLGPSKTISLAELESLEADWTRGGSLYRGDARITSAALEYLGVEV